MINGSHSQAEQPPPLFVRLGFTWLRSASWDQRTLLSWAGTRTSGSVGATHRLFPKKGKAEKAAQLARKYASEHEIRSRRLEERTEVEKKFTSQTLVHKVLSARLDYDSEGC